MMFYLVLIWIGGARMAYGQYRGAGSGRISSFLSCTSWPVDLGRAIAREVYRRVDPE